MLKGVHLVRSVHNVESSLQMEECDIPILHLSSKQYEDVMMICF